MSRPARKWVYTQGGVPLPEPLEVGDDWRNVAASTGDLGKFEYDNLRATDGTPIDSRTRRRDYMRANGLADPRDFAEGQARREEQRYASSRGITDNRERREQVGRALHERSRRK